ncbi:two-component regulator propeller domain-containing protein [Undibacterium sp. Di24W]
MVFLLSGLFDAAQAGALHRLRFDHFSVDQGLPSTGVMNIYQTRDGYIWIATANGLVRYDGRHMQVFSSSPDNPGSISHNRVFSLFEDSQQNLWIGTRRGLDRLDLKTDVIQRFPVASDISEKDKVVYGIAQAGPKQLWVATSGGLKLLDVQNGRYSSWQPDMSEAAYFSGEVRAMLSDGAGGVWIGQGHRVAHISQSGRLLLQFQAVSDSTSQKMRPVDNLVRSLAFDPSGQLWVGLTGGLSLWSVENKVAEPIALPIGLNLPKATITAIVQDQEKSMWLALNDEQGLFRWRSQQKRLERFVNTPAVESSLSGNSLTSLMLDATGALWVGTSDFGVNLIDLNGRGFQTYLNVPGDPRSVSNRLVSAVIPDQNDYVWLGTLGGGLNRLHLPSGDTERFTKKQMGVEYIRALLLDSKKQLWVGGESLEIFDPKKQSSRTVLLDPNFPIGARVNALSKDDKGNVWVGTSAGLYRVSTDMKITAYRGGLHSVGSFNDDVVDSLLFDSEKRLWVGTKGALFIWRDADATFEMIGKASKEIANPEKLGVTGLRQDVHGRIWAATLQGLLEVQPNQKSTSVAPTSDDWNLVSWAKLPGSPDDVIESIQDADNGEIWLSTERGLIRVDPERKLARSFLSFGRFEGAFNFGAAARTSDGGLLFGGVGLVHFHPENIRDNSIPPRVIVSDILLFNKSLMSWNNKGVFDVKKNNGARQTTESKNSYDLKSVGVTGNLGAARKISLNHEQTMVSFELVALHFYNRTQNRYAWKLEGYDKEWIVGHADRGFATYTNLDAGNYRLLGRAANSDGIWSESTVLLEVVVLPPYWKTPWWYGLWTLVILGLFALFYQRRVQGIRASQLYLEQQVKRQTQEVLEQKRLAEIQREIAERARNDIGRLSEIGLRITASLDVNEILGTLYDNIRTLISASTIGVGFVDWEKRQINFDYTLQGNLRILPYSRSLDALEQPATQCVLKGQEVIIDEIMHDSRKLDAITAEKVGQADTFLENGLSTENSRSGIYVPLTLSGRVMGLIGVLSMKPRAFGLDDLNILRTLAAYTAVAYDNAEAYRRLQLTQSKLVEQEKLAALGSLVAGVAHELNTPIGNSLLMASTMLDMNRQFLKQVQTNQLRRSDLEKFCENTSASSDLMIRNLTNAANLVSSFKQIAVDQTSDQRRTFDLLNFCEEVVLTLSNRIKRDGHALQMEVEAGLELDSYPGSLGQVLSNLIINAMVHGLQEKADGLIRIGGRAYGVDKVILTVEDNGQGIAKENIDRIFEPFFTTRLGKGGSGLGLHICYNMVSSLLGGSIKVDSEIGHGAQFTIILPRVAPLEQTN